MGTLSRSTIAQISDAVSVGLSPLSERISSLERGLRGTNGEPGLIANVALLLAIQKRCEQNNQELFEKYETITKTIQEIELTCAKRIAIENPENKELAKKEQNLPVEEIAEIRSWARTRDKILMPLLTMVLQAILAAVLATILISNLPVP